VRNRGAFVLGLAACLASVALAAFGQTPPPLPPAIPGPPPLPGTPPQPAKPAGERYFYDDGGRAAGPFSLDEIVQLIKFDRILPSTTTWKASSASRMPARDLPELEGPPWPGPCGGANHVIWDTFREPVRHGPVMITEDSKLKIKAPAGKTISSGYNALLPDAGEDGKPRTDSYEACLALQAPRAPQDPTSTFAGLKFGVSPKGYLAVLVDASGRTAIFDARQDPPVALLDWRRAADPIIPSAKFNVIQVVVKAGTATVVVNGAKLDVPPIPLGLPRSRIGIEVHSEEAKDDTWKLVWAAGTEDE
jgi:hypothetical protein